MRLLISLLGISCCLAGSYANPSETVDSEVFRQQIEADWLLREQYRRQSAPGELPTTTQADAAGGIDGIKDGKWGFHTGHIGNPWWQVDLGESQAISRVVVWNRVDDVAPRADRLSVLLSEDGEAWRTVYTHDGTTFYGFSDQKPLVVEREEKARYVRIQLPGRTYLHLDEVEVFGPDDTGKNLALRCPADQITTSTWSNYTRPADPIDWAKRVGEILDHSRQLAADLSENGLDVSGELEALEKLAAKTQSLDPAQIGKDLYCEVRWVQRKLALANPLLNFDSILFTKRVPGSYSHMSDQYYGWWSRPGGGIYILRHFTSDSPSFECLTESFQEPGSFLRPMISFEGDRVLFAWCKHYPHLAAEQDKLNKANVPEDAFYHVFEMNIDGTGVRQLTRGKYDDFDARYLPDGRIVFLSTRRGQAIQCGVRSAQDTLTKTDLPDSYVRCGGGPPRPVAIYTLHTMNPDGTEMCAISPFENFEWTPSIADDGTILYSRWDYVDRHNMPYMSLWRIRPDGTNSQIVYGNFTKAPHCTFEPACIPGSDKIIFTASGHHAQTMGSLVLLDPTIGTEGDEPITRLTPEVPFPEIEAWPETFYAHPWPLSERFHLVSWSQESTIREGRQREPNGMGIYLFDAEGNMELLYRDRSIGSVCPIPVRPRSRPPALASSVSHDGPQEGRFLLADVYRGLKATNRGDVKSLRLVAVPAKTHPTMNFPRLGVTRDDPGKCVLGTVPVEEDGSAFFRVPAGVIVFFQALDAEGMAIQTMRTTTHVQPGQTLSCVGCHESRTEAPTPKRVLAALREPSKIVPGPAGSWPLRFDQLVQPVLDNKCVRCHSPDGEEALAAKLNLTSASAYESLVSCGTPSLRDHVMTRYLEGLSIEGSCAARMSPVLAKISDKALHPDLDLDPEEWDRLIVWMDTYAQLRGAFSEEQERELEELKARSAELLASR